MKEDKLLVLTTNNIYTENIQISCESYDKCIDCASDPDCMWSNNNKKCIKYDLNKYK